MSSVFKIHYFMWNFSGTRCIQVGRFRSSVTERFLLHLSFTFQWLQLHIALFACFLFQSLFLCDFLFLVFFFLFYLIFHSLGWFSVLLRWKVNKFSFKSFPFWVAFNLVFFLMWFCLFLLFLSWVQTVFTAFLGVLCMCMYVCPFLFLVFESTSQGYHLLRCLFEDV